MKLLSSSHYVTICQSFNHCSTFQTSSFYYYKNGQNVSYRLLKRRIMKSFSWCFVTKRNLVYVIFAILSFIVIHSYYSNNDRWVLTKQHSVWKSLKKVSFLQIGEQFFVNVNKQLTIVAINVNKQLIFITSTQTISWHSYLNVNKQLTLLL